MNLEELVAMAAGLMASDVHVEPGLPAAMRIRGELKTMGEPIPHGAARDLVREAVGKEDWQEFLERRSYDTARTISGVRCRINALHSIRGVGLAIRLLPAVLPTTDSLNLHPSLKDLVTRTHGLILVSGPTGCGKSSTLAALLQEINLTDQRHILTIEQPVEYFLRPHRAYIRQREVGRDTPSFEQALLDAMREDPDVIMVGEMREPACMRLTLNAAETGHLVLATVHSSNVAEAIQRMVLAFPAEIQPGISAQLADCLEAVVCQRLRYLEDFDIRVPECEILTGSSAARACIRQQHYYKLGSVMEISGSDGMWTWDRYRSWLERKTDWKRPGEFKVASEDYSPAPDSRVSKIPRLSDPKQRSTDSRKQPAPVEPSQETSGSVLVIEPPDAEPSDILSELEDTK
jgi:twitching motility protein PilT